MWNILNAWENLKGIRKAQGFASTGVEIFIQRNENGVQADAIQETPEEDLSALMLSKADDGGLITPLSQCPSVSLPVVYKLV